MNETLVAHLLELRTRIVKALLAVLVVLLALMPFANDLYSTLAAPLLATLPNGSQMIAMDVTTPFFVPLKVALLAATVLALPFVLYQMWAFVAPGLYQHEKRLVAPLIMLSTLLFIAGMAFAYFLVFPIVFGFMSGTAPAGVTVMPDIQRYLDFILTLFVAFGITFEVPVFVIVAVRAGLVTVAKLREIRPYMIVFAFVMGAIFTPPDVISQFMLAVPLCLLYEVGILAAGVIGRRPQSDAEEAPLTGDGESA